MVIILQRSTKSAPGISRNKYPMKNTPIPKPNTSSENPSALPIRSFANATFALSKYEMM